ncbi:MAG: C40 family peptidase [Candidatus Pacearchaeota archaeon]|nr:C40 family peptidase [Candidatus Pacearchaeota archaeon]
MLKTLLFFLVLNGNNPDSNCNSNYTNQILNETGQTMVFGDSLVKLVNSSNVPAIDTASMGYKLLNAAEEYLGVPYAWGGRSKKEIDCMGLIFLAYSKITGKSWKNLSVYPSKLVKSGKLGKPVKGLDGVVADSIVNSINKMEVGDIIYLLTPSRVIEDDSLVAIDSTGYWPWHMGLYAGNGNILHANPCASENTPAQVIREPLSQLLERTGTLAIFVTRIKR